MLTSIAQAAGLGLGVALLLWLTRRYTITRRVRLSVLGSVVALGAIIILRGAGQSAEELPLQFSTSAFILLVANAGLQLVEIILWDFLLSRRRKLVVPQLVIDVFNVVALLAVALIILNRVFNVDLNAVLVTSTVASAVIGLALQDTLGNVISGLALQIDRPFDVGHWVDVSGREGEVMQMNWRTITLRSIDNHHIVIANSNAARQDLVNYSWPTVRQRLHASVGLSYTYPPGDVKRVLYEAVIEADGVLNDPKPDILIHEYGDSAIIYDVRYWIADFAHTPEIKDAVLTRIWYAIRRNGMSVPFPIRDVNLRQITEEKEARDVVRLQEEIFNHLRPLPVFSPLDDEQIEELAQQARVERYTAGEALVRQGDVGDSLFVVKTGETRIDVADERGRVMTAAHRGPAEFFGEMSLLTGEKRSASVIALTETEVIVVDKIALANVISGHLSSLEALTHALAERQQELATTLAAAAEITPEESAKQEASLLVRIQGFLGLK